MINTRKIAVNRCFGGFGLSHEAMMAYGRHKGITLYPEEDKEYPALGFTNYWTVPEDQRPPSQEGFHTWSLEDRQASNAAHTAAKIYDRDIPRDDPALIAAIEELGETANSRFAKIEIVEIPADVNWQIEEYDGNEHIAETHRTW